LLGFFTNILEQENLGLSRDHLEKIWGCFEVTHELIKKMELEKHQKNLLEQNPIRLHRSLRR